MNVDSTISLDMQIKTASTTTTLPHSLSPPPTLIANTGCSAHFVTPTYPLVNLQPSLCPKHIHLPNGTCMISTHEGKLNIPTLPQAAQLAHSLNSHLFPSGNCVTLGVTSVLMRHPYVCVMRAFPFILVLKISRPNYGSCWSTITCKSCCVCPCSIIFTSARHAQIGVEKGVPNRFSGLVCNHIT